MTVIEFFEGVDELAYKEFIAEYPEASPEAIEASLEFLRVAAKCNVRHEALLSQYGLTSGRYSLLMLLRREPTRALSPSELARRTHVSRATMTQFVDALEKDQLAKRIDDPKDRRGMLIKLTHQGDSLLKKILPDHLRRLSHLTQVLDRSERKQLLLLLEKLTKNLAAQETKKQEDSS